MPETSGSVPYQFSNNLGKFETNYLPEDYRPFLDAIGPLNGVISKAGTVTPGMSPSGITYSKLTRRRVPISPIDENFLTFETTFSNPTDQPFNYDMSSEVANGVWTMPNTFKLGEFGFRPKIPYYTMVMDVSAMGAGVTTNYLEFGFTDFGSSIYAYEVRYDKIANEISIVEYNNGVATKKDTRSLNLTAPFSLAIQISYDSVTAWAKSSGSPWILYSRYKCPSGRQAQASTVLNTIRPVVAASTDSGNIKVTRIATGYAGSIGIANQSQLRYEDGTPIVKGNKVFFVSNANTAASATDFPAGVVANCISIFSFDLNSYKVECVSKLSTTNGTIVQGQNSGMIIYDRSSRLWRCFIPNWSDYNAGTGIFTYQYVTDDNILQGVHVLSGGTLVSLPTSTSEYDPDILKIGGTWYCAYASTNTLTGWNVSYTTLASSSSVNGPWTLIGQDTSTAFYNEGQKLQKFNGTWHVLAVGNGFVRYYDLTLTFQGSSAPAYSFSAINNHPNMLSMTDGGKTYLLWVGWDNIAYQSQSLSWGEVVVQISNQYDTGRVFDLLSCPFI